ncbi:MAG TPA: DUF1360 domain-containing protein [Vicinamibacterales bacterium]|jgi:hypothetical protein
MQVPDWYALLLLALAAYRTWKLLAEDTILDFARDRMGYGLKFLKCPWCLGFWIAVAWWGAWQAWPHGTLISATVMALSAIVGVLGWAID